MIYVATKDGVWVEKPKYDFYFSPAQLDELERLRKANEEFLEVIDWCRKRIIGRGEK